jgi:DNA replication protein DnaC
MIDDPGNEFKTDGRGADFINSLLEEVVRYRVSNDLPTIITSNLDPSRFRSSYGASVGSLLTESTLTQSVLGADVRQKKYKEDQRESDMNLVRPVVIR